MIVEMSKGATKDQVDHVVERAHSFGFDVQLNLGTEKTVVAILGSDTGKVQTDVFAVLPGVESVTRVMKPYKLASREFHPRPSKINVSGVEVGGQRVVIMAGPCAVESEKQLMETAKAVKELGAAVVRGGAFKPRTSPFSFQGLERDALKMLAKVKSDLGIPVITEVVDIQNIGLIAKHADILQVGARNMQNFALLKELSKLRHPILLKRAWVLKESFRIWYRETDRSRAEEMLGLLEGKIACDSLYEFNNLLHTFTNWREEMLNYFDHRITNGFVEGKNNRIKTIKRMAYGYRNMDNFRMRILATNPGCKVGVSHLLT